jgi:hypothetical protein
MRVSLILPIPPSTNNLYSTVMMYSKAQHRLVPRRVKSADAREYAEWVRLAVIAQYGLVKLVPPIRIDGILYTPNWNAPDVDNNKVLGDALAQALGYNDNRVVHNCWDKIIEAGQKPRVELVVEGVEV